MRMDIQLIWLTGKEILKLVEEDPFDMSSHLDKISIDEDLSDFKKAALEEWEGLMGTFRKYGDLKAPYMSKKKFIETMLLYHLKPQNFNG